MDEKFWSILVKMSRPGVFKNTKLNVTVINGLLLNMNHSVVLMCSFA